MHTLQGTTNGNAAPSADVAVRRCSERPHNVSIPPQTAPSPSHPLINPSIQPTRSSVNTVAVSGHNASSISTSRSTETSIGRRYTSSISLNISLSGSAEFNSTGSSTAKNGMMSSNTSVASNTATSSIRKISCGAVMETGVVSKSTSHWTS